MHTGFLLILAEFQSKMYAQSSKKNYKYQPNRMFRLPIFQQKHTRQSQKREASGARHKIFFFDAFS